MHDLCVVFDVDDTLYLERDYVTSGFQAVGAWVARWLAIADFDAYCLRLFESGQRANVFDSALRECGYHPNSELISGLVAIYRSHIPRIRMMEDVAQVISEIGKSWPLAIITDGPVIAQSRKCEALALSALADPVILTEAWGDKFHKPQPAAFRYVMSRIKARTFVYVADNPAKDFTALPELGWRSVRVRRPGGLHCDRNNDLVIPDFELTDCTRLRSVLNSIIGK